METKQLNSQESIELIQRMISATRQGYEKNGGRTFLIWGYTSFGVALFYLLMTHLTANPAWGWAWWAIPIIGWPIQLLTKKPKPVTTYVDKVISIVWCTVGAFAVLFPLVAMFSLAGRLPVIPIETMLLCMGVIITGLLIKFRPLVVGGIVSALLGFAMYFVPGDKSFVYLFAAMFVVGMVVPGHILNYKARCSKN